MSVKVDYRLTERYTSDYHATWKAIEAEGLIPLKSFDGKVEVMERRPHWYELIGPTPIGELDFYEYGIIFGRVRDRATLQRVLDLAQTISKATGKHVEVRP